MGASTSACLLAEDIEELLSDGVCKFSSSEIQELYKRFQALDRGQYGVLCSKDIKLVPEIAMNPLCDRILALFNRSGDDVINFKDFVSIVWIFSANCPIHQKYEVAFEVFDIDQDNRISCDDLRWILRAMVGSNMDDEQLDQIVVKTIGSVDLDRVAFEQRISASNIQKLMTVDFNLHGLGSVQVNSNSF